MDLTFNPTHSMGAEKESAGLRCELRLGDCKDALENSR